MCVMTSVSGRAILLENLLSFSVKTWGLVFVEQIWIATFMIL